MYKVEILQDDIQKASIHRRQQLDAERKLRIFNPKIRTLGVFAINKIDLSALQEQIYIKNELATIEKQRNAAMDRQATLDADILQAMDREVLRARRHQATDISNFRKEHQQAVNRREYDLNDPHRLRKDLPARISDVDPRCGPSGLQKFDGEDLGAAERKQQQMEQIKVWTNQQIWEKERINLEESAEKQKYEQFQKNILGKMDALQSAVNQAKREEARFDSEYNQALANDKRQRAILQKEHESALNAQEIRNHVNGEFLSETPNVLLSGNKIRVDSFKGITHAQKQHILDVQNQQRKANQQETLKKQNQEDAWAVQDMANRRTIALLDRANQRAEKERAVMMRKENELKALQDKERQRYIDKELYTNPPQDSYFMQFNTTSR